jgi:DNA replication regulator DPB11
MDDNKHRDAIGRGIVENGGAYLKSIQKGQVQKGHVTHLLCGGDGHGATSEKIDIARKFNEAQARRGEGSSTVHIVWEEWYWDSLEFEGEWTCSFLSISLNCHQAVGTRSPI